MDYEIIAFRINNYNKIILNYDNNITTELIYDQGELGNSLIDLKFNSHMRDFEVIEDGLTIAGGQGVGVIIDFPRNKFIKLWKDGDDYELYVTIWSTEDPAHAKSILSADLGLGYDVYIIDYNHKTHQLCESMNTDDENPTPIIFPHLQKYAKYDGRE